MRKSQIKKPGRRPTPVTLYNQETGEKKTWKSMALAAEELGVSYGAIVQIVNGTQKTIKGKWMLRSTYKPTVMKTKDNFRVIDVAYLNKWRELAKDVYALQLEGGLTNCQFIRTLEDMDVADSLGVQEINLGNHGADGRMDGHILYEHKNKSNNSLDVVLKDLPLSRVEEFSVGYLTVSTIWKGFLQKKYSLVFNSSKFGEQILKGQKNYRKEASISFNDIIKTGGKVVAWDGDIAGAMETLKSYYPDSILKLTDICGPADAKMVARQVMEAER
jgi:hypothetical protein